MLVRVGTFCIAIPAVMALCGHPLGVCVALSLFSCLSCYESQSLLLASGLSGAYRWQVVLVSLLVSASAWPKKAEVLLVGLTIGIAVIGAIHVYYLEFSSPERGEQPPKGGRSRSRSRTRANRVERIEADMKLRSGLSSMGLDCLSIIQFTVPLSLGILMPSSHLWFTMVVNWIADAAGLIVGKLFGRTRLAPRLSPGKTVEGLLGSLGAAVMSSIALTLWGPRQIQLPSVLGLPTVAAAGIALGIANAAGDLAESLWKRAAGAKESGFFFPGHGGVLDKIDGLVFAIPITAAISFLTKG